MGRGNLTRIMPAEFRISLLVVLLRCYPGLDEKETAQSESGVCGSVGGEEVAQMIAV